MLRSAGKALFKLPKWLLSDPDGKFIGWGNSAMRIVPDGGFAALTMLQAPGDPIDKGLMGGAQFGSSLGGGLLLSKLGGRNQGVSNMLDLAGSVAGDFASMPISEKALQLKNSLQGGPGVTPWAAMEAEQRAQYAQQLQASILQQYGIIPGTREQYAQSNGIA